MFGSLLASAALAGCTAPSRASDVNTDAIGAGGATGPSRVAVAGAAAAPAGAVGTPPKIAGAVDDDCAAQLPDAFLRARLAGALERELAWSAAEMRCAGMNRPDGRGLRVSFTGDAGNLPLTLVFAAPRLARGASSTAVPVNVTLVLPDGRIYGTLGEDKCLLDEVHQAPFGTDAAGGTRWRVEARGFCLEPARAVGGDGVAAGDAILPATFDFAGIVTWEADPAAR